jgi:hypothetical protein
MPTHLKFSFDHVNLALLLLPCFWASFAFAGVGFSQNAGQGNTLQITECFKHDR